MSFTHLFTFFFTISHICQNVSFFCFYLNIRGVICGIAIWYTNIEINKQKLKFVCGYKKTISPHSVYTFYWFLLAQFCRKKKQFKNATLYIPYVYTNECVYPFKQEHPIIENTSLQQNYYKLLHYFFHESFGNIFLVCEGKEV